MYFLENDGPAGLLASMHLSHYCRWNMEPQTNESCQGDALVSVSPHPVLRV